MLDKFNKKFIAIRYWLIGMSQYDKDYLLALKALEYAKDIHTGFRKDNVTPEFQHQIDIVQYIRTLKDSLIYPAQTIAAGFLHDVPEDYDISFEELEQKFGKQITHSVQLLTKKHCGTKKSIEHYYLELINDPIGSIVKGSDRINNQGTMHGVFSYEKQLSYCEETENFILPMLKESRRIHVEQEAAYENIKFVLQSQIQLVKSNLLEKEISPPEIIKNSKIKQP